MPIGELTSSDAVERALAEFDELGRDAFLAKYRFGRAKRWYVERDGRLYDSKAIAGVAIGYQHPERGPMWNNEFSGGERSVKAKLEALGFTVVDRPEGADSRQAWLFQSNPDYYDLDRALRELPAVEWTVRGHLASVHAGDHAYIWRAGRQAGVVAVGTVLTEPAESAPSPEERPYWRQPDRYGFDKVEPRIRVSIDRIVEPPLLRTTLRDDPVLSNLTRHPGTAWDGVRGTAGTSTPVGGATGWRSASNDSLLRLAAAKLRERLRLGSRGQRLPLHPGLIGRLETFVRKPRRRGSSTTVPDLAQTGRRSSGHGRVSQSMLKVRGRAPLPSSPGRLRTVRAAGPASGVRSSLERPDVDRGNKQERI